MAISPPQFNQLELPVGLEVPSLASGLTTSIPTDLVAKLTPTVEDTIKRLKQKNFIIDPIAGSFISPIVSVMSAAYKRHGNILERAIFERLKENQQFEVWNDPVFSVSAMADSIASESLKVPSSLLETNIPYEPNGKRTLQVDILVFDKIAKTLRAYEVKRGNGEQTQARSARSFVTRYAYKCFCGNMGLPAATRRRRYQAT
jgi:hypothetical protein